LPPEQAKAQIARIASEPPIAATGSYWNHPWVPVHGRFYTNRNFPRNVKGREVYYIQPLINTFEKSKEQRIIRY